MKEQFLLKISFIISLLGITALLLISRHPAPEYQISNLSNLTLSSLVKIQGKIINSEKLSPDFFILTLQDETGQIEILLNKNFSATRQVQVTGTIDKYGNKTQIQADKIIEI